MDKLSDEIIALIIYELADPSAFSLTSRRHLAISGDVHVRASYFLVRHGPSDAFFAALSHPSLLSPKMLDLLVRLGAHLSRYLLQIAIAHYFRAQCHFIKGRWVRGMDLECFTHLLQIGVKLYGSVPTGKAEDDGTLFMKWLEDRKFGFTRGIDYEQLEELFVKYKFIPFSSKDPLILQVPLAFATEPRLLPLAAANGFVMDQKYKNFLFRKIFEKREGSETAKIVQRVKELCQLDSTLYLSRTVAAEVCMEARQNAQAYEALKILDSEGVLLFQLGDLVEDLLKTFAETRSITVYPTYATVRHLFTDFPSSHPTARLAVLLTFFSSHIHTKSCPTGCHHYPPDVLPEMLENCHLVPLTRDDVVALLCNPFVESHKRLFAYAKMQGLLKSKASREEMAIEVALKSYHTASKGKFLKAICRSYPNVQIAVRRDIALYHLPGGVKLPDPFDTLACGRFVAPFSRPLRSTTDDLNEDDEDNDELTFDIEDETLYMDDHTIPPHVTDVDDMDVDMDDHAHSTPDGNGDEWSDGEDLTQGHEQAQTTLENATAEELATDKSATALGGRDRNKRKLGSITQDTLTKRIGLDEQGMRPARRRWWNNRPIPTADYTAKLPFPSDALHVAKWAYDTYGPRDLATSIFMTHAVANCYRSVIEHFVRLPKDQRVPITFRHFEILAHLGKSPLQIMWKMVLEMDFLASEEDWLSSCDVALYKSAAGTAAEDKIFRMETPEVEERVVRKAKKSSSPEVPTTAPSPPSSPNPRKRPRRSAASHVSSYVVPGSDDDAIKEDEDAYYTSEDEDEEDDEDEDEDFEVRTWKRARVSDASVGSVTSRKGKGKAESDLQTWIKHFGLLLKNEERKFKERKALAKPDAEAGKPRLSKTDFHRALSTNLRLLRQEEKRRRTSGAPGTPQRPSNGIELFNEDDYSSSDEEYMHMRPAKRPRIIGSPQI